MLDTRLLQPETRAPCDSEGDSGNDHEESLVSGKSLETCSLLEDTFGSQEPEDSVAEVSMEGEAVDMPGNERGGAGGDRLGGRSFGFSNPVLSFLSIANDS